jgi:hypothetical protein
MVINTQQNNPALEEEKAEDRRTDDLDLEIERDRQNVEVSE